LTENVDQCTTIVESQDVHLVMIRNFDIRTSVA